MNEENKVTGEISGFDDVAANGEQLKREESASEQQGYFAPQNTEEEKPVVPENEPAVEQTVEEPQPQKSAPDFFPSGTYGMDNDNDFMFDREPVKIKKEKRCYGAGVVILSAILAAIIGAAGCLGALYVKDIYFDEQEPNTTINGAETNNTITNITVDEQTDSVVQAIADKATPSVVGIRTTFAVNNFFGGSAESTGEGSGVIYTTDGYIITNYHVIQSVVEAQSGSIMVYTNGDTDGTEASVVGYNISNDLAVLKINKTGLQAIEVASSANLKTGQYVAVIGCPGGLDFMGSVSYGIVSGLNRKTSTEDTAAAALIQTDAAINPGNSGGAMVNTQGQLVGVPSSKIASTEYEGMGFAIPSDTVVEICNRLIAKENEPEPYVGINVSERYDATTLKMLGFPAGAVVQSVTSDSPAEKAGIKRGDIIIEFGGTTISSFTTLANAINDRSPGDTVTIKFYRGGKYYSTSITIEANS